MAGLFVKYCNHCKEHAPIFCNRAIKQFSLFCQNVSTLYLFNGTGEGVEILKRLDNSIAEILVTKEGYIVYYLRNLLTK